MGNNSAAPTETANEMVHSNKLKTTFVMNRRNIIQIIYLIHHCIVPYNTVNGSNRFLPVLVDRVIVFVVDGDYDVVPFPVLVDDGVAERQQQDEQQEKYLKNRNIGGNKRGYRRLAMSAR